MAEVRVSPNKGLETAKTGKINLKGTISSLRAADGKDLEGFPS